MILNPVAISVAMNYEVLERVEEVGGEWKVVKFWTGKVGLVDPYGDLVDPVDAPIGARNLLSKYR